MGAVPPTHIMGGLQGEQLAQKEIQEGSMTAVSRVVGEFLAQRGEKTDLIAVNHAGAVPFYSRQPTLDMTGLNDYHNRTISRETTR